MADLSISRITIGLPVRRARLDDALTQADRLTPDSPYAALGCGAHALLKRPAPAEIDDTESAKRRALIVPRREAMGDDGLLGRRYRAVRAAQQRVEPALGNVHRALNAAAVRFGKAHLDVALLDSDSYRSVVRHAVQPCGQPDRAPAFIELGHDRVVFDVERAFSRDGNRLTEAALRDITLAIAHPLLADRGFLERVGVLRELVPLQSGVPAAQTRRWQDEQLDRFMQTLAAAAQGVLFAGLATPSKKAGANGHKLAKRKQTAAIAGAATDGCTEAGRNAAVLQAYLHAAPMALQKLAAAG